MSRGAAVYVDVPGIMLAQEGAIGLSQICAANVLIRLAIYDLPIYPVGADAA